MAAKSLLTTFWERYRKVYPQFELFAEFEDGRKRPEQCIPIYLHGDEGVTYKKGGVLIFSWQSPLGYGSSRRPHQMSMNLQDMGECGLPLNFLKSGMYSRLLSIICPKDLVQQKCWFQKCCNIVFFLFPWNLTREWTWTIQLTTPKYIIYMWIIYSTKLLFLDIIGGTIYMRILWGYYGAVMVYSLLGTLAGDVQKWSSDLECYHGNGMPALCRIGTEWCRSGNAQRLCVPHCHR